MSNIAGMYRQQAEELRIKAKDRARTDVETLLDMARHFEEMAVHLERQAGPEGREQGR